MGACPPQKKKEKRKRRAVQLRWTSLSSPPFRAGYSATFFINVFSEIIQNRDFSQLVDRKENLWFEAKNGDAYDLNSPNGRYELAKDVSALANAEGGYIIIGLKSEPLIEENTDKVIDLDLIRAEAFRVSQYEGVINEYIYPGIRDIKIEWVEDISAQGVGVEYILVPNQEENRKFFLIKNIMEEGELIRGIVFGIAQRLGSSDIPLTIEQLHQKIQQGKSPLAERLSRIEEKLDLLVEGVSRPSQRSSVDALDERIRQIESEE